MTVVSRKEGVGITVMGVNPGVIEGRPDDLLRGGLTRRKRKGGMCCIVDGLIVLIRVSLSKSEIEINVKRERLFGEYGGLKDVLIQV